MPRTLATVSHSSDDTQIDAELTAERSPGVPTCQNESQVRPGMGAVALLTLPLAACGGGAGGGGGGGSVTVPASTESSPPATISDQEAARFLLHAQFSASDSDIAAVKNQGYKQWLAGQFSSGAGLTAKSWLDSRGYNAITTAQFYFKNTFADNAVWNQLITAPDQLRKRLVLALSEHFVAPVNTQNLWASYITAAYWDMLNATVFGNFRQLLEQVTLNLNVGIFLNLTNSSKADAATGAEPDENFARECMQLFTIGLTRLNNDGSPQNDLFGNSQATFTNSDVTALATVMTGYRPDVTGVTSTTVAWENAPIKDNSYTSRPMAVVSSLHARVTVQFLGTTIATADPAQALASALDTLFNHPNVGPFFAKRMIQRLVTSNPSAAYIGRVAAAFNNNGSGVRGDLQAVWTAILTDPEALAAQDATTGGKLREPIIRFVQWARTAEVSSATGEWLIQDLSAADRGLGQSPLRSPAVFNFFRPGYVPPNTKIAQNNLVAPEFQILNETTTAGYLNFMLQAVVNGVADVTPQYTTLLTMAADTSALINWLNLHMTGNQLSANTVSVIQQAVATIGTASPTSGQKLQRVQAAIYLVLSSPEYLIQK